MSKNITLLLINRTLKYYKKWINKAIKYSTGWIDVTYIQGSDELGKKSRPILEIVKMLWEESLSRIVIEKTVKYKAQSLE
jgi:hypothetical protein